MQKNKTCSVLTLLSANTGSVPIRRNPIRRKPNPNP